MPFQVLNIQLNSPNLFNVNSHGNLSTLKTLCHFTSQLSTVLIFNFPPKFCKNNISMLEFVILLGCSMYWSIVTVIYTVSGNNSKPKNINISRFINIHFNNIPLLRLGIPNGLLSIYPNKSLNAFLTSPYTLITNFIAHYNSTICMPYIVSDSEVHRRGLEEKRNGEIEEVCKYNPVWNLLLLTCLWTVFPGLWELCYNYL